MQPIFHICTKEEARKAKESFVYIPKRYTEDGFIHCSYLNQVCDIANHLFKDQSDLVLLEIDPEPLGDKVVSEDLYSLSEDFPHIYSELPWAVVVKIHDFPCEKDGSFVLPKELRS